VPQSLERDLEDFVLIRVRDIAGGDKQAPGLDRPAGRPDLDAGVWDERLCREQAKPHRPCLVYVSGGAVRHPAEAPERAEGRCVHLIPQREVRRRVIEGLEARARSI
jgi:hypothetical protein